MVKKSGLARVAGVYGLIERMRSAQLLHAAADVAEASAAVRHADDRAAHAAGNLRGALALEDSVGRAQAEVEREAAQHRRRRLLGVETEREKLRAEAEQVHRESRISKEQVEQAVQQHVAREAVDTARRLQAMNDDRYLSRRAWSRRQDADERQPSMKAG